MNTPASKINNNKLYNKLHLEQLSVKHKDIAMSWSYIIPTNSQADNLKFINQIHPHFIINYSQRKKKRERERETK